MNTSFLPSNLNWIATDQINGIVEFLKAINWKEPWLMGLVAFHIATLMCVILTRKHTNFQAVVFVCLLGLVFASEYLNALGEKHWRTFSKEQYFDSHGLFIAVVLSTPVLINCFLMVVMWLWTALKMLVVVGKGRIKEKRKKMTEDAKREVKKEK